MVKSLKLLFLRQSQSSSFLVQQHQLPLERLTIVPAFVDVDRLPWGDLDDLGVDVALHAQQVLLDSPMKISRAIQLIQREGHLLSECVRYR